ncbi:MAG: transcription elongation factor GreA [Sphaerochaeta sp.]
MGIQDIEQVLKEEQWTRASVSAFTVANFETFDGLIEHLDDEQKIEARDMCEKHIREREKNSVVAHYINGIISIQRKGAENFLPLLNLIELFSEHKRWNIVEFLAQKVLAKGENRHALRLLAHAYDATNKQGKKIELWERLVSVDYEEVDILKQLGTYALEAGKNEKAIGYFKKTINRLLKRKDFTPIRQLHAQVITLDPAQYDYSLNLAEQISLTSNSSAVAILRDTAEACKANVDQMIEIQKRILTLDRDDAIARDQLIKNYRLKYKDHSRLESCLESSALVGMIARDVLLSIEDFETNIAFDKGTFVFQNSTGRIGRIRSIDETDVIVDFAGQSTTKGSRLSTNMAFKSLQALPKSHIWVLKSALPKQKLHDKVKSDVPWTLNILMASNGGQSSLREMKAELVPSILEAKEWTSWMNQAKKELMTNPLFDLSPTDSDVYLLRSTPISYEEKQLSIFRSEREFYDKVKRLREFIASKGDVESDYFQEMVRFYSEFFFEENGILKPIVVTTDAIMASYLLLEELVHKQGMHFIDLPEAFGFLDLFERAADVYDVFAPIKDSELKKSFIDHVVAEVSNWPSVLMEIFPGYLTSYIPEMYRQHKKNADLLKLYKDAVENFKEKAATLIYLLKSGDQKVWAKSGYTTEQLLYIQLQLLDTVNRYIDAKRDSQENRKNSKALMALIFDDKKIFSCIESGDEETAQRIYSLVANVFDLPGGKKIEVKHAISVKFPSFKFFDEAPPTQREAFVPTGLFCTAASLDAKKKEIEYIQHVELPEIAKEIGAAREMGDLRENSEYKYGKEKQNLVSNNLRRLAEELDRATVITPDMVDDSKVGFGTKVTLMDNLKGEEVTYTIMGPWESNPNENIINISAPFGRELVNHEKGERFTFSINEQAYDFTVQKIEKIKF